MMDVYKKLEAEGKIGKFFMDKDGQLRARPFQEFPKTIRVKHPDGSVRETIVNSAREELAAQTFETSVAEVDPVVKERNELLEMVAERDAKASVQESKMAQLERELMEMRELMAKNTAKALEADEEDEEDE